MKIIKNLLYKNTYEKLYSILLSLSGYITPEYEEENRLKKESRQTEEMKKYDVFISHANKDKVSFVDELFKTIKRLGVNVFYDTDTFSWGDNWKQLIYEGTAQSEFAIIVISENFFDREWAEKELKEFLERQNTSGQKIILPLLYNISKKKDMTMLTFLWHFPVQLKTVAEITRKAV